MGSIPNGKKCTSLPATQVGPRPVESGLGGHEEGVFRVDEGVENTSIPLRKRGRMVLSDCATFNGISGVNKEFIC